MAEVSTATPSLELRDIVKRFGGLTALDGVSIDVYSSEIVALVGDNGAGKSTLVKIVAGVHQPTEGTVYVAGEPVDVSGPEQARAFGIEVVYQDLALANQQQVFMNMYLGREMRMKGLPILDKRAMVRGTEEILSEFDIRIPSARSPVRDLSGGQRQGIAIGRATHWAKHLLLMDEPTAALGVQETGKVEEIILRMRERGLALLVVSHNLDQVFRIADRIAVLRRGKLVGVKRTAETDGDEIVAMITGLR